MNPNMSIVVDIDASPAIKKLMALKNQAPKKYSCKFIEPGIVSYEDSQAGKVYISKETLDKFCPQFEGKPVVMKGSHRDDVGPEQFDEEGVGIVGKVYYNEKDGWYWCDFYIWGEEAQKQADGGESVSCAYTVTETGEGGTRNQIEYDQEILNGEPKHIALVPNPRYEGAKIVLNSIIGGSSMKIKGWWKKLVGKDVKNAVDPEKSLVEVDGEKVALKNLISAYQDDAIAAAEVKKKEGEENLQAEELGEDSTIDVDGKPVKISEMMNSYRNKVKKNAAEEEKKNTPEKEEKENKEDEDKKNAAKEEEDKKNAAKEEEDKKNAAIKEEEEKKNAAGKEDIKKNSFTEIKNAVQLRDEKGTIVDVSTIEEKREKGKELYGSK